MTNNIEDLKDIHSDILDSERALQDALDELAKAISGVNISVSVLREDYKKLAEFYQTNQI